MTIEKNKTPKSRERKNKSHKVIEASKHYIFDEEAYIFRTDAGGKFWSLSFWVSEEGREYRKSLRTKNREDALIKAKDEFLTVKGKIKSGIKIWDITVESLIEEYLEKQNEAAEAALKTKGRVGTIKSQLKHFTAFIGLKTKLNDIDPNKFVEYAPFRRKNSPTVQNVTLNNEKSTIKNLLLFAQKKGYINRDVEWDFGRIPKIVNRREAFTDADYKLLKNKMKSWEKGEEDLKVLEHKKFMRDFILILGNTGLRFGECRKLQWKDVRVEKVYNKDKKKYEKIIRGHLDASKTKNRKERIFVGRYGLSLERIKTFSKWTKPNDFVFVDNDSGNPIDKKVYYKYWAELMRESGLESVGKDYSFYCLRHMFATYRLNAGISVFDLSKIMGCSVKYIEEHYGQIDIDTMKAYLTKDRDVEFDCEIISKYAKHQ